MGATEKTTAELLATPLQFVKGVGPQRAELLAKLDLHAVRDVLFFFPRDYQDFTQLASVSQLVDDTLINLQGVVDEFELRNTSKGGSILGVLVREATGTVRAVWFNQPFLVDRFCRGQRVLLTGRVRHRGLVWEMTHPRVQWLEGPAEEAVTGVLPIYPLTDGLSQHRLREIVRIVLNDYGHLWEEVFPEDYRAAHDLSAIEQAFPQMHFPDSMTALQQARRRFIYQELFILQLALALRRGLKQSTPAPPLEATARIDARIRRLFPFELTPGQNAAITDVAADMSRCVPMNRLLQGDVGSGKTMVAVYALLLAVAHGQQAALMAPTEILARQHFETLGRLLVAARLRVGLLVGGLSSKERKDLLAGISAGEVDVVLGTQAIIQSDVEFAKLGLVVIDEQHKFGVRQRASLKGAAVAPHYLVMTATPIPRTVSLTVYGDLDVSVLRDGPPGRQNIHTYLAQPEQREKWWEFFRKKLREGRQGYVVAPLVEESDRVAASSLAESYEALANGELEEFRLGLIHGRMSAAEKDAAMQAFRTGQTQVLVSTTVIEVGVDVPNATLITIEGGERFGLSQLHQLRGRIGRGSHPGYCCVFAEVANPETRQRLEAFVNTQDGFELAELDFQLRGGGDLFGTRQHGLPPFWVADLVRDKDVLEEARRDAQAMLVEDPGLAREPHARLRAMVVRRYGDVFELGDVG